MATPVQTVPLRYALKHAMIMAIAMWMRRNVRAMRAGWGCHAISTHARNTALATVRVLLVCASVTRDGRDLTVASETAQSTPVQSTATHGESVSMACASATSTQPGQTAAKIDAWPSVMAEVDVLTMLCLGLCASALSDGLVRPVRLTHVQTTARPMATATRVSVCVIKVGRVSHAMRTHVPITAQAMAPAKRECAAVRWGGVLRIAHRTPARIIVLSMQSHTDHVCEEPACVIVLEAGTGLTAA